MSIATKPTQFKDVKKHNLGTYETDKSSLSCIDNKRYVLDDRIYTLAFFFIKIVSKVVKRLKKIVINIL